VFHCKNDAPDQLAPFGMVLASSGVKAKNPEGGSKDNVCMHKKRIVLIFISFLMGMLLVTSACIIDMDQIGNGVINFWEKPSRTPNPTQAWYATATSGTWEYFQQLTAIVEENQNQP
jgi:hypothetical protein